MLEVELLFKSKVLWRKYITKLINLLQIFHLLVFVTKTKYLWILLFCRNHVKLLDLLCWVSEIDYYICVIAAGLVLMNVTFLTCSLYVRKRLKCNYLLRKIDYPTQMARQRTRSCATYIKSMPSFPRLKLSLNVIPPSCGLIVSYVFAQQFQHGVTYKI
jgi:hypothetical protein